MDVEIYKEVLAVSLGNPEADMELYYQLLADKQAVEDLGLPVEEKSYSFTGLGLRK